MGVLKWWGFECNKTKAEGVPCFCQVYLLKNKRKRTPAGVQARHPGDAEEQSATHLFGQQGDEVSLKLRLDHLHHMLDLCGLTAVNQLIQRQQLLWASPALQCTHHRKRVEIIYEPAFDDHSIEHDSAKAGDDTPEIGKL